LLPFAPAEQLVTVGEGQTLLQAPNPARFDLPLKAGNLHFQYEGMNPSGSFKDNGMAAAFTAARMLGRRRVGCASTGNTSASLALYASQTPTADGQQMQAVVFIGEGKIAYGKLSQALDYGALTLQIDGDFDACLSRIREAADRLDLYLMNSVNPFRLEGQKTIMYRVLEGLGWEPPDWIVCPGGNLGNASAFGKAFAELKALGLVPRMPRLAIVNASGANTLNDLVTNHGLHWNGGDWDQSLIDSTYSRMTATGAKAKTIASAIEIGRPVNLPKALRALDVMSGVTCEVTDDAILDEKARIGRYGYGCEPASAASLAGLRQLIERGVIGTGERVVCILTGHQLKDPDATVAYHTNLTTGTPAERSGGVAREFANRPIRVANDIDAICRAIEENG
jgi:threonine synthase